MAAIIEVRDMVKTYVTGDTYTPALKGVSLTVDEGEFLAIMGPSGSGKSTLMNLLGLLDTPTSGSYQIRGVDVSSLDEIELAEARAREIGFVFQSFNLLPRTTHHAQRHAAARSTRAPRTASDSTRPWRRWRPPV